MLILAILQTNTRHTSQSFFSFNFSQLQLPAIRREEGESERPDPLGREQPVGAELVPLAHQIHRLHERGDRDPVLSTPVTEALRRDRDRRGPVL